MKRKFLKKSSVFVLMLLMFFGNLAIMRPTKVSAANPYLPLWEHVPDGETRVFEDPDNPGKYRAYLIGSHDLRNATYCGPDIVMWSAPTDDLNNWRNEGPIYTFRHPDNKKWANMFAPDLVEVLRFAPEIENGERPRTAQDERTIKEYYLYPHPNDVIGRGIVCKSTSGRPEGPYEAVNLNATGTQTVSGSVIGFDPSVLVDYVDDPSDPDYNIGFRAYCYYGWTQSTAAELNQKNMYSVRPLGPGENAVDFPGRGTAYDYFIPVSSSYGVLRDDSYENRDKWRIADPERAGEYNYFEAFAIRKIDVPDGPPKYLVIFSGYSGPDYNMGSTNSAMRYLYGDSPMGPWRIGGVIVDSRGPVLNENGTGLTGGTWGHNTHGGPWFMNDQWYIAYHRPPNGDGGNRQAMVAPIKIDITNPELTAAEGGSLAIRAYDPYAKDEMWTAKTSTINPATGQPYEYTGAEITSEGFNIYGLDPYEYYSAGYTCYVTGAALTATWDIWDNHMPVNNVGNNAIIGYKYFGFGGLDEEKAKSKGIRPFEGTKEGNNTQFNVFLTPKTANAATVEVWLDGPWANDTWKGKKIGTINIPAGSEQVPTKFTVDVSSSVDGLEGKHAIFLRATGGSGSLFDLQGLGFSSDKHEIERPVMPTLGIQVNGDEVSMPARPIFSSADNGITDHHRYTVTHERPNGNPVITATASDPDVKIIVTQPTAGSDQGSAGLVRFIKDDVMKLYRLFSVFKDVSEGEADQSDVDAILEVDKKIGSELTIEGDGTETPQQKATKVKSAIDKLIQDDNLGINCTVTPNTDGSFLLSLSKGATVMTIPSFTINELKEYKVTLNPNGGTLSDPSKASIIVKEGDPVGDLPTPGRSGYTFNGWFTAAVGGNKIDNGTIVTGDVTYYAQWTENTVSKYTVTFDPNGGALATAQKTRVLNGGAAIGTLPAPTRPYYTFNGWYTAKTGGTKIAQTYIVNANVTLYAQWKVNAGPVKGSSFSTKKFKFKITKQAIGKAPGSVQLVAPLNKSLKAAAITATVKSGSFTYNVEGISKKAFKGCKSLKRVTIGGNVTKIGNQAFSGASKLKSIKINTTKLKSNSVGKKAFKGISKNAKIKVPSAQYKAYKRLLSGKGQSKSVKIIK